MWNQIRRWLLKEKPVTWSDDAAPLPAGRMRVDELPPFHLGIAEQMRFDPQVRIAMGARNGLLLQTKIRVEANQPNLDRRILEFVRQQWAEIWSTSAYQMLRAKLYGFLPFEVMFRAEDQRIVFDRLEECHPRNVKLLTRQGKLVGFSLEPTHGLSNNDTVQVLSPKALVCTFGAEFGNWYGCSLLERAYPAWHEKWMKGGAKKTLRLRMIKDAYIGDVFWYPPDRRVEMPDGSNVSWRDIAKEIVESRQSGGAMTLPMVYDHAGRKLVDYTPPQDLGGATGIFEWKRDVDNEIWKALEMPPEVIEAAERGSGYSGRSIPLLIAMAAVQSELAELIACVDRDVLRPLVQLNFGQVGGWRIKGEIKGEVGSRNTEVGSSG